MFSQQHTVPMTGDSIGEDHSSGPAWPCTQPVTSQRPSGGFQQRLRHTSCTVRAVAAAVLPSMVPEEDSIQEGNKLRNWGSVENLLDEQLPISRSPSLPILNSKLVSSSKFLHGSKFSSRLVDTPNQSVKHFRESDTTPQKQNIYTHTPSAVLPKFAQDLHSKVSQMSQQNRMANKVQRTPLQTIPSTPQQLEVPHIIKAREHILHEKENTAPQQAPFKQLVNVERRGCEDLVQTMLHQSPGVQLPKPVQVKKPSPPYAMRSLFEETTEKHKIQANQDSFSLKQEPRAPEVSHNGFDTPHQLRHFAQQDEPLASAHRTQSENFVKQQEQGRTNKFDALEPPHSAVQHFESKTPQAQRESYGRQCGPEILQNGFDAPGQSHVLHQLPHTPRHPSENYVRSNPEYSSKSVEPESKSAVEQRPPQHTFKQPAPRTEDSRELFCINGVVYLVDKPLGRGGSSEVYQVTRQADNQVLALKCVNLRGIDDNIKDGYLNEITWLQRMQGSPRVVQMIDFELCKTQQRLYVVMEKGARDLASFLKDRARRRDLRLGTVEAFWRDMVEAVADIHEQAIIHLDLKPANFLLVGEVGFHQLKLIDFGIASSMQNDMTSMVLETPAGTLNYMSPEAVRGMQGQQCKSKINYKSDIWSLGCILYNLLYGRTPFQHITHAGLKADAICNPRHAIEFPSQSPSLPGDGCVPLPLLRTVQACLRRDPAARPTARQLLNIKYCGCEEAAANGIESLALGLASLIKNHPLGKELSTQLVAALQMGPISQNQVDSLV